MQGLCQIKGLSMAREDDCAQAGASTRPFNSQTWTHGPYTASTSAPASRLLRSPCANGQGAAAVVDAISSMMAADEIRHITTEIWSGRQADLVLLELVLYDGQAARAQQVALHELVACLKVAAQPDAHQRQIAARREEIASLQIPRRLNLAHHWQPCSTQIRVSAREARAQLWLDLQVS